MSRNHRHIKSQHNITYEELYVTNQQPTDAAFISKEIMETNEETAGIRQTGKIVYSQSALDEDKKAERQETKKGFEENMEGKPIGFAPTYV